MVGDSHCRSWFFTLLLNYTAYSIYRPFHGLGDLAKKLVVKPRGFQGPRYCHFQNREPWLPRSFSVENVSCSVYMLFLEELASFCTIKYIPCTYDIYFSKMMRSVQIAFLLSKQVNTYLNANAMHLYLTICFCLASLHLCDAKSSPFFYLCLQHYVLIFWRAICNTWRVGEYGRRS